jgi:glycosyltransferase involved in cell wall biosynthesis
VGIDATSWTNRRGFGRHTRSLVSALLRIDPGTRYTTFLDSAAAGQEFPEGADVRLVTTRRPTAEAAAAGGHRSVRDLAAMSRALSDPSLDVILYPNVWSYVPVWSRARKVVAIHDVIAETFPALALGGRGPRLFWGLKAALARRQAAAVLTQSEFSRRGIVERLGLDPGRIFVTGVGSDPAFRVLADQAPTPALRDLGLAGDGRWIVYVGGFSPHKRLDLLVDVFHELAPRFSEAELVLVGDHAHESFVTCHDAIRAQVERLGLSKRVHFTGFLPDPDLAVLLNRATVLVLPSMMEGFGLPGIEAAACGCPVVATTASPLPEALGAAAIPVSPGDRGDLVTALVRVLGDARLRCAMRAAGPAAAAVHTWERAAERVASVLRMVANGAARR